MAQEKSAAATTTAATTPPSPPPRFNVVEGKVRSCMSPWSAPPTLNEGVRGRTRTHASSSNAPRVVRINFHRPSKKTFRHIFRVMHGDMRGRRAGGLTPAQAALPKRWSSFSGGPPWAAVRGASSAQGSKRHFCLSQACVLVFRARLGGRSWVEGVWGGSESDRRYLENTSVY